MPTGPSPVEFYDRFARDLAERYDSVSFVQIYQSLLHYLPTPPARVLDVGAGAGRDAEALNRLGYTVTAVEPAVGLRLLGQSRAPNVEWLDDRLPQLSSLGARRGQFDFILCAAVLMSVAETELPVSLSSMAGLLGPIGKILVSVREPGPDDAPGLLVSHSDSQILDAAEAAGLALVEAKRLPDVLGRPHDWRVFIFEPVKGGSEPGTAQASRFAY